LFSGLSWLILKDLLVFRGAKNEALYIQEVLEYLDSMGWAIGQYAVFLEALKHQGWNLSIPFVPTENAEPYDYEDDEREIVWIFFLHQEEDNDTPLVAEIEKGLWDEYVHEGQVLSCGGAVKEAFWIKPNGTVVCHNADAPLSFPFQIPMNPTHCVGNSELPT
jgi:hypothetical protein